MERKEEGGQIAINCSYCISLQKPTNSETMFFQVVSEEEDVITNLREYNSNFKPFRDPTETGSVARSVVSSTGSTIHPDVVKARVRQSLERREKRNQPRRTIAKGEASAKTRSRRDNKHIIQSSTDAFWG